MNFDIPLKDRPRNYPSARVFFIHLLGIITSFYVFMQQLPNAKNNAHTHTRLHQQAHTETQTHSAKCAHPGPGISFSWIVFHHHPLLFEIVVKKRQRNVRLALLSTLKRCKASTEL